MISQVTIPVMIKSANNLESHGEVWLRNWEKKERTLRAFKSLGICWGLAIVTVFIPLAHFILVPSFLLAGPVLFFMTISQEQVILGGKGICPKCKKEFNIVRSQVKWPISDLCNHCQTQLKIETI
jgi:hypothetical protein